MRRIGRDGDRVEPNERAFLRDRIGDLHGRGGRGAAVPRLDDVAIPAEPDADFPARQVVDELRRVEVADMKARLLEQGFRGGEVRGALAVRVETEVDAGNHESVFGNVDHRDAAFRELRRDGGIKDRSPAVDAVGAQDSFDHGGVVPDAYRTPGVADRVV